MHHKLLVPVLLTVGVTATLAAGTTPVVAAGTAPRPATASSAAGAAFLAGGQGADPRAGRAPRCVEILASPMRTAAGDRHWASRGGGTGVRQAVTHTVTVIGTSITGQPAGGRFNQVFLFNADDSARFDNPGTSVRGFSHGVATFHVPAGHYWAVGDFTRTLPRKTYDEYLDVLPQFTVNGDTTVHVTARAATSQVQAVLPRPAVPQDTIFQLVRSAAAGPPVSVSWLEVDNGPKSPEPTLYISPTSARPTAGKLATVTIEQLGTAAYPQYSRYLYGLAYASTGTIPSQRHVVKQAALATVTQRYYSDIGSWGLAATLPAFPVDYDVCGVAGALFWGLHFPRQQTFYLQASPALSWQTAYIQTGFGLDTSGGQVGFPQVFIPGERQTQDFGAYPLHPAPDVRLDDIAGLPPTQVSAGRAGDTLRLAMTAFSDSVPGHLGQGTFPPVKAAASYQVDQNGMKIAGGTVPHFTGAFAATAALSPSPSLVRFTLDTSESAQLGPLSAASSTVWTWRSAPERGARLPAGWTCLPGGVTDRACQAQPMMTLRYGVVGLGLNGSASPGQQVVLVHVGHLQLTPAARITRAAVSVSFDDGNTWRAARMTGRDGSYAAVFAAPAGARVTLRTSAADGAGGSVTETIINAYQVAS